MAIKTYRDCLAEDPGQPNLRVGLAQAWLLNGKADKTRHEVQILLQEQSDNPKLWELLGHSYLQNEQFGLAAQAYRGAIDNGADPAQLRSVLNFCARQEQAYAPVKDKPALDLSADFETVSIVKE